MFRQRNNSELEAEPTTKDHEDLLPPGEDEHELPGDTMQSQTEGKAPESGAGAGDPRDQVIRLQAERDALFDRLARQQAEFENLRKRSAREQAEFRDYALANTVKSLLPIIDSFDLALKAGDTNGNDVRKGLELIRKQMDEVLSKLGVQRVPAEGEPFDPRYHEAIEMVDSSDVQDNQVVGELQRGYKMKDRLLRPAMVRVARNSRK